MQRTPVPSSDASLITRATLPNRSLSEWIQELDRRVEFTPELIGKLYDTLHKKHFGKPSWRRNNSRNNIAFGRAFAFCVRHEIDPAAYISANMALLRDWLKRSRIAFQPTMLVGEKAEARYNGYMRRANRRFRRGDHRVFDVADTQIGRLRNDLYLSEHAVAEHYVALRLRGRDLPWEEVASMVTTSQTWKDVSARSGAWFDLQRPEDELLLARVRAAWAIAETYRHGLGDSIGFTDFSWRAFADLIARLIAETPPVYAPSVDDLRAAKVRLWNAGGS